jgi:hypothetical protein
LESLVKVQVQRLINLDSDVHRWWQQQQKKMKIHQLYKSPVCNVCELPSSSTLRSPWFLKLLDGAVHD